jgi:uncharacterized protein GlcG (DUF336 family)
VQIVLQKSPRRSYANFNLLKFPDKAQVVAKIVNVKVINLEQAPGGDARQVIAAAEAKAHELGQPMNIAVVDAGGNLVSHVRMDGAWIGSIDVSINKAFTARAFDISTAQLSENSQPGQQFYGIQNSKAA